MIFKVPIDAKINDFENGQQAIDYLKNKIIFEGVLPNAIFLDLCTPVFDDLKSLKAYTFIESCIKDKLILLIISPFSHTVDFVETDQHSTSNGCSFTKPVVRDKLIEIIESTSYYQSNPCVAAPGPNIYFSK